MAPVALFGSPAPFVPEASPAPFYFYYYADGALDHSWLRGCLGFEAIQQSTRNERMAEVPLSDLLRVHPQRTTDPSLARLFFVPVWEFSSLVLGGCNGTSHSTRMQRAAEALSRSEHYVRSGGRDHIWATSFSQMGSQEADVYTQLHGPFNYSAGLAVRTQPLSRLLGTSVVGRYKRRLRKVNRVSQCVVEVPYRSHFAAIAAASTRGVDTVRRHLLHFAGTLDVNGVGTAVRCSMAKLFSLPQAELGLVFRLTVREVGGGVCNAMATQIAKRHNVSIGSRKVATNARPNNRGVAASMGREMANSVFCLIPAGDTCEASRIYSAVAAGCLPVVLCDTMRGAFPRQARWETFWIKPSTAAFMKDPVALVRALRAMPADEIRLRQAQLQRARQDVVYDLPDSRTATNFLLGATECIGRTGSASVKPKG